MSELPSARAAATTTSLTISILYCVNRSPPRRQQLYHTRIDLVLYQLLPTATVTTTSQTASTINTQLKTQSTTRHTWHLVSAVTRVRSNTVASSSTSSRAARAMVKLSETLQIPSNRFPNTSGPSDRCLGGGRPLQPRDPSKLHADTSEAHQSHAGGDRTSCAQAIHPRLLDPVHPLRLPKTILPEHWITVR